MNLQQYMAEQQGVVKKWENTLLSEDAPAIRNTYRLTQTALMLEQQQKFNKDASDLMLETGSTNVAANIARWDPVLVSMVRRAAPVLMAFDFGGVQTLTQPSGLIFTMAAYYGDDQTTEALFNAPDTAFTGQGTADADVGGGAGDGAVADAAEDPFAALYSTGRGMPTATAEGDISAEMNFKIDKILVEPKERQLKGSYTVELQQDMRVQHNMDAETELANIMSTELLAEINREFVRQLFISAKLGAENTDTPGTFDLASDADGRWSVEKWKTLSFQIGLEANKIGTEVRRGLGNKILASPDVITALHMAGALDTGGATSHNAELGNMDHTQSTFVGRMHGRYDVHVDPYTTITNAVLVGYKGQNDWDAGIYYCPYTPFQMLRAVNDQSFQPRIAYKTRYGMVSNPVVKKGDGSRDGMDLTPAINPYFRKFKVGNLI